MLTHQRGERIVAAGEAWAQLLDCRRRRRLVRPLPDFKGLARQCGSRLHILPRPRSEAGDVANEIARSLLDQSLIIAHLTSRGVAEVGMREHSRRRLARITNGIRRLALRKTQCRKVVE